MSLSTYLTASDADALAAMLPGLAAYKAISDSAAKLALLMEATSRIDSSRRYQGRRYESDQELELPRLPYNGCSMTGVWTIESQMRDARLATLYEADAIAEGTRDRIGAAIAAGLTGQSTASVSEQYRQVIATGAAAMPLCARADQLMNKYRLRSGGIR